MKKRVTIQTIIFFAMAISVLGFAFSTSQVMAQQITLTFATNTPPSGFKGEAEIIFIEELEKASGGKIKVKPFWAESLVTLGEMLKGVADGIADMGQLNIAYYPTQMPINSGFLLFDQGPVGYMAKIRAYKKIYKEIPGINEELEKNNQKIVYMYASTPIIMAFNRPVKNMSQIKGLKVRTPSRYAMFVLKALGAEPVNLPWGDVYMAMQTNSIQGVIGNMDNIHRTKLYEVAPHMLMMDKLWTPIPFLITINKKKWESLPEEVKQSFSKAAANAEARFADRYNKWVKTIISDIQKGKTTITTASKADYDAWLKSPAQQQNHAGWIKSVTAAGVKEPERLIARMEAIVKEEIDKEK
ncbi:MAG: hypothetical protein CVU54_13160 [Deltaproteobacteria bacterium HGW-Deltaproteobacteria-12]|jgi:TRAP-type C4-dicarboxylate transport system substrate-binding protein|nr:MAG: hypothetical protein CVU54_13160 [Deltaproteobacteria bacterium HGW-Deltaproteobacteria-12]